MLMSKSALRGSPEPQLSSGNPPGNPPMSPGKPPGPPGNPPKSPGKPPGPPGNPPKSPGNPPGPPEPGSCSSIPAMQIPPSSVSRSQGPGAYVSQEKSGLSMLRAFQLFRTIKATPLGSLGMSNKMDSAHRRGTEAAA